MIMTFKHNKPNINSNATPINLKICKLQADLKNIENLQLKIGEQIATMLFDQVRLVEKSKSVNEQLSEVTSDASAETTESPSETYNSVLFSNNWSTYMSGQKDMLKSIVTWARNNGYDSMADKIESNFKQLKK